MANILIDRPREMVPGCKLSRVVSIFVLCTCMIINSKALPQSRRVPRVVPVRAPLATTCTLPMFSDVDSEGGKRDGQDFHLGSTSRNRQRDDHAAVWSSNFTNYQDVNGYPRWSAMNVNMGDLRGEKGTLNATGSPEHRVNLFIGSGSETTYKGGHVYLVNAGIYLRSSGIRREVYNRSGSQGYQKYIVPRVAMSADFQGLFSPQTGVLCATFCAGKPQSDVNESPTRNFRQRRSRVSSLSSRSDITPAEFIASVGDSYSDENVTTNFVKWDCDVHIEVQYPRSNTIATPIVTGVMNSLRAPDDAFFFHPIHIYGISKAEYEYNSSVSDKAKSWESVTKVDIAPENRLEIFYLYPPFCPASKFRTVWVRSMSAVFDSSCNSTEGNHCGPFRKYDDYNSHMDPEYSPLTMRMENIHCTEGPNWKISAKFIFKEMLALIRMKKQYTLEPRDDLDPLTEFLLVAEGYWNVHKPGQLVMVAYYLASNGTPVDTKIQITMQFPTVRTIHHRYGVVGHIRSMRKADDALHFKTFSFLGEVYNNLRMYVDINGMQKHDHGSVLQLQYRYDSTVNNRTKPVCEAYAGNNKGFRKNTRFPDGSRASDFTLFSSVQVASGPSPPLVVLSAENSSIPSRLRLWPLAIRDRVQSDSLTSIFDDQGEEALSLHRQHGPSLPHIIPMSFKTYLSLGKLNYVEIAAEGLYNSETGHLCMLGCRHSADSVAISHYENGDVGERNSAANDDSCDVVFSIQYPPTNPRVWDKRPFVTGNVTSLLDASHPLYFQPLVLNSTKTSVVYREQTAWSVLRRNLETILSLVSLSLTTLFVAIQVGYSGKETRFKNLRFVSLVMLIILTSGHLIPLLLSVKAIWIRRRSIEAYRWNAFYVDKWAEAYEVIMRGTSMVALIFELRFVQLVLKSRSRAGTAASNSVSGNAVIPPNISDTLVLRACLPLYAAVMTVVAIVHWHVSPGGEQVHYGNQDTAWEMIWADIVAFSGVVVDLFLVPQVIANAVWDIPGKVAPLYPVFYIGMTLVRSAAHLFDAGRAMNFITEDSSQYFYANPNWDLYSTTWDILIPCVSILLATLLFFQQKYGGRCFVPLKRSRPRINYEQVPSLEL